MIKRLMAFFKELVQFNGVLVITGLMRASWKEKILQGACNLKIWRVVSDIVLDSESLNNLI